MLHIAAIKSDGETLQQLLIANIDVNAQDKVRCSVLQCVAVCCSVLQ